MPGLGTSFGFGGATTFAMDLKHSDTILIMGSNMAECHPVAFRWVMQAKTRPANPATLIHADPRFTRTSAMADIYAPLRAGSDIVFLGALVKFMLDRHATIFAESEVIAASGPGSAQEPKAPGNGTGQAATNRLSLRQQFFRDYVVHYTNAATLITDDFKDTDEDNFSGLFSGFDPEKRRYDTKKWRYDSETKESARSDDASGIPGEAKPQALSGQVGKLVGPPPKRDPTLHDPRCVFQILRRHYERYTPELVEQVCGTPRETFLKVAETLYENSGPDRTSSICYAVGWTQHTVGVQIIRTAAILQLLLGNIGRPGGGILALRGHATIQGSTDIATLYNILPGYLYAPSALRKHDTLYDYLRSEISPTSYWVNFPKFVISQLKAWFGDNATEENDYGFGYLPRTIGDHSHQPMFVAMAEGAIKGFFAIGQNPAVGGQNASFQRQALSKLDWLVVRDLYETETASFWKDSPEVESGKLEPEQIQTEVFFLPAAAVAEMNGSFTNTQRLIQWHEKAADPRGDARSDVWFTVHLGMRLKNLYADSDQQRDRPIQALVWNYFDPEHVKSWQIKDEPSAELILKEINGYHWTPDRQWDGAVSPLVEARPVDSFEQLKEDGTTACGGWIYSGIYAPTPEHPLGHNRAANREGDEWVAAGWAFAWPANQRILYNRASADPQGNPWPKERRLAGEYSSAGPSSMRGYVYWDSEQQRWTGFDVPHFPPTKPPDAPAQPNAVGIDTHDGTSPFIMKADGKGWLFVPNGLVDGPLPTHYEPMESPVENAVYRQQNNPVVMTWRIPDNAYAPVGSPEYPCVLSTYRLTEHHLSGSMSRWLPWLAELQPELFCEISPEHAQEIGVENTGWVRISTPRSSIRAKALVTRRIRPYRLKDKTVHHVGLPWHWGYKGLTTGDVVNDLSALVGDPNVSIHEAKVFVCKVERV